MNKDMLFTKDALEVTHEIIYTANQMYRIIQSLQALGIPAGDELDAIQNHIVVLANECKEHIIKEQHEQMLTVQNQTWDLVGAVFEDAVSKMK